MATREDPVSTKRLLDLSTFYLTAGIVGVSKEAEALARVVAPDLEANIDHFFAAPSAQASTFETHGFKGIARAWAAALTRPLGSERVLAVGRVLVALYDVLERKGLLRSTFATTEDATAAMKLSKLREHLDDNQRQLDLIGSIQLRGVNSRTRKWTRKALAEAGATVEGFDDLVEEVATATALGQDAAVQGSRIGLDPEADAARREVLERLDTLVEGSSAPEQVLAAAAAGAASAVGKGPLKTQTGRALFAGNTQQEDAMTARGRTVLAASAGSGKTRVIAAKVVYHVKELGVPTKQVIATSFTRKSGAELIDRIKKYSKDDGIMDGEARDGFGTTHAIAKRILDRYLPDRPQKRMIGPKDKGGEFSQGELLKIAVKQVQLPGGKGQEPDPKETFFPNVDVLVPSAAGALSWPKAVFKALEWLKTDAADALRRIPRYGTGPGWDAVDSATGIFKSIATRRLGPEDLTSKQLMRVREVFRAAGFQVDMHDMTARFISAARDFSIHGGDRPTSAKQWFNLNAAEDPFYAGAEISERQLGSAISRWKGLLVTPGVAWAQAVEPEDKMLAAGYGCYEWLKSNDPAYMPAEDGDDHLIGFCRTLIENATVRARIQARFKIVIVDEAQDTSPCQHLMFGLITGTYDPATQAKREDDKMTADTFMLVGDDRQSIYSFRGADPDTFINNSDTRGGAFQTKFLSTNYRSARKIVEAANKLIANNTRQIPMVCEVPADRAEGSVRFASHLGWDAASADITSRIKGSVTDGSGYSDFGIGVRTNAEGMQLATALLEAGIPFKSNKFKPLSNYLIKGTLNWMLLGHTDESQTDLLNALILECSQTPKSGIGKATLEGALDEKADGDYLGFLTRGGWQQIYKGGSRGRDVALPFVETIQRVRGVGEVTPLELLQHVLKEVPGLLELAVKSAKGEDDDEAEGTSDGDGGNGPKDDAIDYGVISPLFRLTERFKSPVEFFQYIRKLGVLSKKVAFDDKLEADDKPNTVDAVTIDTVHGWKGLEVKHMIVPMSSRTFPSFRADIEDERRLAYVAVTRGEESVTILSVQEQMGDRVLPPSQFVREMGCDSGDGSGVSGSANEWDSLPWHEVIAGWSEMRVDRALTKLNLVLAHAARRSNAPRRSP